MIEQAREASRRHNNNTVKAARSMQAGLKEEGEKEADAANKESVSREVTDEGLPADLEGSDVTAALKTQWLSILFTLFPSFVCLVLLTRFPVADASYYLFVLQDLAIFSRHQS